MIWARFEFIGKMEHTKLSSGKDKWCQRAGCCCAAINNIQRSRCCCQLPCPYGLYAITYCCWSYGIISREGHSVFSSLLSILSVKMISPDKVIHNALSIRVYTMGSQQHTQKNHRLAIYLAFSFERKETALLSVSLLFPARFFFSN
jgi:hypothetical protein